MSFVRNVVGVSQFREPLDPPIWKLIIPILSQAVFPLFTPAMYDSLGIQGAGGLTAGIGTLLSITPFVLFKYGSRLRARSPFAQELARLEAEHAASLAKTAAASPGPTASTTGVRADELKEILP
jgi:hypothetical protein